MIHETAIIEKNVKIGKNTSIWHFVHVRSGAIIDDNVSIGRDVYIDTKIHIKKGTKIQNGVSVYAGVNVGLYCFLGPHVTFTNDLAPRAGRKTWKVVNTYLEDGASIGAGSVIVCGAKLQPFCLIGSGSVVIGTIPAFHLASGSPARVSKMICACGNKQFPLGSSLKLVIQDCCHENLFPEVIKLAKKTVSLLIKQSHS
jgi:acetyltransferase-like isoleucine patch superfamily enzyme